MEGKKRSSRKQVKQIMEEEGLKLVVGPPVLLPLSSEWGIPHPLSGKAILQVELTKKA
jgi:hypothetical protein